MLKKYKNQAFNGFLFGLINGANYVIVYTAVFILSFIFCIYPHTVFVQILKIFKKGL